MIYLSTQSECGLFSVDCKVVGEAVVSEWISRTTREQVAGDRIYRQLDHGTNYYGGGAAFSAQTCWSSICCLGRCFSFRTFQVASQMRILGKFQCLLSTRLEDFKNEIWPFIPRC
jgi:hypothetical protein